jgi:peroxiredoxin
MKDMLKRVAPDFSLPIVGGVERLTLSALRGQVVILNFWSAECSWSRRADVVLAYRMLTWERKGVRIVGLVCNINEPEAEVRYEADNRRIKYPLVLDIEQKVTDLYRVDTTPHLFVLDRQGVIRYSGALDDATYQRRRPQVIYIDQAINAVLAGEVPNPAATPPYGCAIVRPTPTEGSTSLAKPADG